MDQITLVDRKLDDGARLLGALHHQNIPLRAACWARPADDDRWLLYIATPIVEEGGGLLEAYRRVNSVFRSLGPDLSMDTQDITLVGENDPVTRDLLSWMRRYPAGAPVKARDISLGGNPMAEAHVYPHVVFPPTGEPSRRRLKHPVEQTLRPDELVLSERERAVRTSLLASGLSLEEADRWARSKRPPAPRSAIPAGTVVKAWVAAHWGSTPQHDPDPLLLVEAADGARGLVQFSGTEEAPDAA